jgi:peptidoglycan-associated lipoprotein
MRFKLLGPMAALVLVAGCPSPEDTTDVDDTGTEMQMEGPTVTAQEDLVINVGDRVFFDFDKSDLRPDAIDTLNRQSDWMSANGSVTVAIGQAVS